jgi:hypothetical protein
MAGRPKHAQLLTDHLDERIDSALHDHAARATARVTIGGVVGDAAGARIGRREQQDNAIAFQSNGWLALGEDAFTLVRRDRSNRPTGDPIARVAYSDVAKVVLSLGMFTTHAVVALRDGRTVEFETPRRGFHRQNRAVLDALVTRCPSSQAVGVH